MRSSFRAQTIIGTVLLSNSSGTRPRAAFNSVMSMRRPCTAVPGQSLDDQDEGAVAQGLLVTSPGPIELGQPPAIDSSSCPAASGGRRARHRSGRCPGTARQTRRGPSSVVDLGISLFQKCSAVGVEKQMPRQDVDGLAEPLMPFSRLGDRCLGLGALVHDLLVFCRHICRPLPASFGFDFAGRAGSRTIAACSSALVSGLSLPVWSGIAVPVSVFCRRDVF